MYEWQRQIQTVVDEIDRGIREHRNEELTLQTLSSGLGYSEFHMTRKFREISGMQFKEYLRNRKLAFALKEIRDTDRRVLDIALDYGFSTHEAFTRAFQSVYGMSPSEYRRNPKPLVLRTKITPFDRYFLGLGEIGMVRSAEGVKVYFITIPAHKFLHIRNYDSNGYWDFWQRQNCVPGQDYETICGLLDSVKGKLDDVGGSEPNCAGGQIMAYINDPAGRLCDWGIPHIECWGARLPADYRGELPPQMQLLEVPEAKREWLAERLKEGHVFRKLDIKGCVFIEYAPLEMAWVPIVGENYIYIYCLWVSGSPKGSGYGKALMEYCLEDAKMKGKSGVCMLGSDRQKLWLSNQAFAEKYGFEVVDSTEAGYRLLALSFDGTKPQFTPAARKSVIEKEELTIYYDMQCPYIYQRIEDIREYCAANGITASFNKVGSLQEAKELPCAFNNWGAFYKGKFITVNLLDMPSVQKILSK